jgi:fibronectin type 3 domain-containing protein
MFLGYSPVSISLVSLLIASFFIPLAPQEDIEIPEMVDAFSEIGSFEGFFIENNGQLENEEILFSSVSDQGAYGFTRNGIMIGIPEYDDADPDRAHDPFRRVSGSTEPPANPRISFIRIGFENGNDVVPVGQEEVPWRTNFFLGSDPSGWRTNVASYQRIVYGGIWDGIDLVYRAEDRGLKYDLIVHPGADPDRIGFRVEGCSGLSLEENGDLSIDLGEDGGLEVMDSGLDVFYEGEPHRKVDASFHIENEVYSFGIEGADPARTFVIDPFIYCTYLGGRGWDQAWDAYVDDDGQVYIARFTESVDFPTTEDALDTTYNGGAWDVYISKLSSSGDELQYSTYFGGSGLDTGVGITADASGAAYISGVTNSKDLPVTQGAFNTSHIGPDLDTFVMKLGPNGDQLVYSTFLGGTKDDAANKIEVDKDGSAYIVGMTESLDFPVTDGCYDPDFNEGPADTYITKLSPDGSSLVFSTYLGGANDDQPYGLDLDDSGCVYVFGETFSRNFPITPGAVDDLYNGTERETFVTKLSAEGNSIIFSTYLGGSNYEQSQGIVVDEDGYIYLAGATLSRDFPITPLSFDGSHNGYKDVFVVKMNISGDHLVFSTFIGDIYDDVAYGLDVDSRGYVYVTGTTGSWNYPTTPFPEYRTHIGGLTDAFVSKLSSEGNYMVYSSYLGGRGDDVGFDIHCDDVNQVYITGETDSTNLNTTQGALFEAYNGGTRDIFALKMNVSAQPSGPRNLRASIGDGFVYLTWRPPMENGSLSSIYYELFKGPTPLGIRSYRILGETHFNDTGLMNGERYYYMVRAWNDIGAGGDSGEVLGIPGRVPNVPVDIKAERGDGTVTLTWKHTEDHGGYSISGYNIYRGGEGEEPSLQERLEKVVTFKDKGLENGVNYTYRISTVNEIGEGALSGPVHCVPGRVPWAPRDPVLTAGDRWVNLTWEEPQEDGGYPILEYVVNRGVRPDIMEELVRTGLTRRYHDDDVSNGVEYFYEVVAVNEIGISRESPRISIVPARIPGGVRNLTIVPGDERIDLNWLAPESNGGSDISGYVVYRGRNPERLWKIATVTQGRSYRDTSVENGMNYTYQVRAFNRVGEGPVNGTLSSVPGAVPDAPQISEILFRDSRVFFKWRAPEDDGGAEITAYKVYRGTTKLPMKLISVVDADMRNFTDDNLSGKDTFFYSVSAVNALGEGEHSEEASVWVDVAKDRDEGLGIFGYWWLPAIIVLLLVGLVSAAVILVLRHRTNKDKQAPTYYSDVFRSMK